MRASSRLNVLGPIALGLLALAIAGCSSQPSAESAAQPSAALASAAAPAATSAATDGEFTPPPGYKKRLIEGQTYYCTKVVVLGSRFPKDDCRSQADLEYMALQGKLMRGDMAQRSSACTSAGGCASN